MAKQMSIIICNYVKYLAAFSFFLYFTKKLELFSCQASGQWLSLKQLTLDNDYYATRTENMIMHKPSYTLIKSAVWK